MSVTKDKNTTKLQRKDNESDSIKIYDDDKDNDLILIDHPRCEEVLHIVFTRTKRSMSRELYDGTESAGVAGIPNTSRPRSGTVLHTQHPKAL